MVTASAPPAVSRPSPAASAAVDHLCPIAAATDRRNAFEPAQSELRSLSHFARLQIRRSRSRSLVRGTLGPLRGQRAIGRKTEVSRKYGEAAQGMATQDRLVYSGWAPYFMRNCGNLVPPHLAGPAECQLTQ